MKLFRKGTDKPIEIFVALFIILAVAMVILQMFSGQISAKTKELKSIEQATTLKRVVGEAKQFCQEKCTNALENDCADQHRAQFCITAIAGGLDMDGDGVVSGVDEYNEELLGGIGVCEDRVYCPQLTKCTCKQELTMEQCKTIVCKYWSERGVVATSLDATLQQYFRPGECISGAGAKPHQLHWYNILKGANPNVMCK